MADESIVDVTSTCVLEFLSFLKANPNVAGIYRTAVYTIVASLDAQVAQAELVIAQFVSFITIQDVILNSYNAIVQQFTSQLSNLPFNEFKDCPGISNLVKFINDNIDPYKFNIPLIGNINLKDELYDQSRRKSYLQFLQNANETKKKFRNELLSTLDFI